MTTTRSFATQLGRLRQSRGLHQTALAERAGVDHSMISRLECGTRDPSRAMVERLAEALDCTPSERAALMEAALFHAGPVLDPSLVALNDWLGDATTSEESRQNVRAMLDAITALTVQRQRLAVVRKVA